MSFLPRRALLGRRPIPRNSGTFSIVLLSAAAFGAIFFTLTAGFFVYSNTQSLVSAKDWVEHTQEVLTSLQSSSQLADRIEFSTRLFLLNRDELQLSNARYSAISLRVTALRVANLVADNPVQVSHAADLTACAERLNGEVRGSIAAVPLDGLLQCREAIGLMSEQERTLLKDRTKKSQHSSLVSLSTECIFVGLSLITLVVLFGILLRDAFQRRGIAKRTAATNRDLANTVKALEERMEESRLLTASRDELQLCTTVEQVYRANTNCMARLLPGSRGSLAMLGAGRAMVEVVSQWGGAAEVQCFPPDSCCGLRLGQPRWRMPGGSEIDCAHFPSGAPGRYLCLPLVAQSETLGVLTIECGEEAAFETVGQHMDGVLQFLQLTGMAVASLTLRGQLEEQSIRDALTGLFNRHFMQMTLDRELARAARAGSSVALFMLDVDHFKRFNDTFGHGAGDAMLRAIAAAFRASVRAEDIICRYGGEEFAIILPGLSAATALERAERVRSTVAALQIPLEGTPYGQATVSIGIALSPSDGTRPDELLRKADQALYCAKHGGRNQVRLAEPSASAGPGRAVFEVRERAMALPA